MLREKVKKYMKEKDCNCAETMLHAADEEWNMGISDETFRAFAGFGGGLSCGSTCGALTGAAAIISLKYTNKQGHDSPEMSGTVKKLTQEFDARFNSIVCTELKDIHVVDDHKCLYLVEKAADLLEEICLAADAAKPEAAVQ